MAALIACWLRVVNFDASMSGVLPSAAPAAPDRHRLSGRGRGAHGGQVLAGGVVVEGLAQGVVRGGEVLLELVHPALQGVDLQLELQDATYAFEPDAGRGELGDLAEQLDVAPGVAASTAARAPGADQPEPVVGAQRLRVQAGQLGGHADHVHGDLGSGGAQPVGTGPSGAGASTGAGASPGHDWLPGPGPAGRMARRSAPAV